MKRTQVTVLEDHELLYKGSMLDGELKEIPISFRAKKRMEQGLDVKKQDLFDPNLPYRKMHKAAWDFLYYKTTPMEYKVAGFMAMKAKMFTNSLKPISDELSLRELADIFNVSKSNIQKVLDRLFTLGVYGKFEACEQCEEKMQPTKYWICNPYLAIENAGVDKSLEEMFAETPIAKACLMAKELK